MLLHTLKSGDACDFAAVVLPDSCQLRYLCVRNITAYQQVQCIEVVFLLQTQTEEKTKNGAPESRLQQSLSNRRQHSAVGVRQRLR